MKKSLFVLTVGLGVGYVLGARAGRGRYDEIVEKVTSVWEDPRVTKARREAARYAKEQAPVVRDRAKAAAAAAPGVVAGAAKDLAGKTAATAKNVAAKVGEVRDGILEDDALEDGEGN
jgi:ferric-dicitrate binding protein FerR (iron transport regulator)